MPRSSKPAYLSEEWSAEALRRLERELTQEDTKGVTATITQQHKNGPDGKDRYLYMAFASGKPLEVTAGEGPGPKADFVLKGDYSTFVDVMMGNLNAQKAFTSGKIRFSGSLGRALRLAPLLLRISAILAGIPAVY